MRIIASIRLVVNLFQLIELPYGISDYFLQGFVPPKFADVAKKNGTFDEKEWYGVDFFQKRHAENIVSAQEDYFNYNSNFVWLRYLHYAIASLNPFPAKTDLFLCTLVHSLLSSLAFSIILLWIRKITSTLCAYSVLAVHVFSYHFITFASSYYWSSWVFLLPICAMILLLSSHVFNEANDKKKCLYLAIVAFITCTIKQLQCFELSTSSLIAMTIPLFYYITAEKMRFKRACKLFLYPTIAAILSAVAVYMLRFSLLVLDYQSITEAWAKCVENFTSRVSGAPDHSREAVREASTKSLPRLLYEVCQITAFSCRSLFSITYGGLIAACAFFAALRIWPFIRSKNIHDIQQLPFIISLVVALLAPFSWYILAKPHAAIIPLICAPVFAHPFTLIATAFIFDWIYKRFNT